MKGTLVLVLYLTALAWVVALNIWAFTRPQAKPTVVTKSNCHEVLAAVSADGTANQKPITPVNVLACSVYLGDKQNGFIGNALVSAKQCLYVTFLDKDGKAQVAQTQPLPQSYCS